MRFLKLEAASEHGGTVAMIAGFGALGSILCILNGRWGQSRSKPAPQISQTAP
jgi:hypothetical protein